MRGECHARHQRSTSGKAMSSRSKSAGNVSAQALAAGSMEPVVPPETREMLIPVIARGFPSASRSLPAAALHSHMKRALPNVIVRHPGPDLVGFCTCRCHHSMFSMVHTRLHNQCAGRQS